MSSLPKRPLGHSGIEVSCLGLGTVKLGRNQQVKYPASFDLPSDREVIALLDQAAELGINLLDTAPAYGSSERRLGTLLSNREQWIISTKVGEEFVAGRSVHDYSSKHVRQSIEASLKNLQTDYLDLVLIHSDGNDLQILDGTDCVDVLQQLKQAGLIRCLGMSSKTAAGGLRALELMDVAMVTYNSAATEEAEVIDYAAEHGKGILVKKAMNSGHLSNSDHSAQQALDFALSKSGVTSVIVGTINQDHLDANVRAVLQSKM